MQRIPTQPINSRVVIQPNTFYTCPAGKKAIIKGVATCTGLGAAASVRLNAAGVRVCEWTALGTTPANSKIMALNFYYPFEIQLAAGETLDSSQDAGANGEVNVNAEVQETPT